jgi:hypothetical protein
VSRVCRLLLRLYPRRWRARYEAEVLAVLELHHATLATHVDLLAGAVDAWRQPGHPVRRGTIMPTPQSRFMRRTGVLLALVALAAVVGLRLQVVLPDIIPNNLSLVWLMAAVLVCAVAGAYVATRGRSLPVGALAGSLAGACAMALMPATTFGVYSVLSLLRVRPFDFIPYTVADVTRELPAIPIWIAVAAAAGAALGAAGWAGQRYAGRRAAAALANRLERLASAARTAAR